MTVAIGGEVIASAPNPAALVGINATADTINRLVVSRSASLFDQEGEGHPLRLNKADMDDTTNRLFQSNYSGRAKKSGLSAEMISPSRFPQTV
ncbi:MAG: hypothetical protein RH945_09340 [Hyphomonas sp.]